MQRQLMLVALELELRRKYGTAFQDFFALVMGKRYPGDYVAVRPYGRLGDKGCDGYLKSTGEVFAAYGAVNSEGSKVNTLVTKMGDDFAKAKKDLPSIMKRWTLVHNFVDGLPVEAILELEKVEKANPGVECRFFGKEKFEETLLAMDETAVCSLLGVVAGTHHVNNLQTTDVKDLIESVSASATTVTPSASAIRPVPMAKLDYNNIPGAWRSLLSSGFENTSMIQSYLDRQPDVLLGERLATWFGERYLALRAQELTASGILSALLEALTGRGATTPEKQVAGHGVLAYFFERCDIFEDSQQAQQEHQKR